MGDRQSGEMSLCTHTLCSNCYATIEPGRVPRRIPFVDPEICCGCGAITREGIYYRAQPDAFAHCRHEDTSNIIPLDPPPPKPPGQGEGGIFELF